MEECAMNSPKPKRSAPKLREPRKAAEVALQHPKSNRPFVLPETGDNPATRSCPEFSEAVLEWLEEEDYL
jgi:hypothetical protein